MKERNDIFGKKIQLTGNEALQLLEWHISEGFLSGEAGPASGFRNLFGRSVWHDTGSDLSFLAGLLATGLRGAAFLNGDSLNARYDQLATMARQQLPTVVHYATPVPQKPGQRSAHDLSAWRAVSNAGCFQLFAANLQELIDFTLIAHKVAESALIPGILAFDGEATGLGKQEARFPKADLIRRFLGDPDGRQSNPTPAQEMLFGEDRRRVPQWFSLDTPTLNGAGKQGQDLDNEAAARERFFYRDLPEIMEQVFEAYGELTGRYYSPIRTFETERADYILLTHGAVFERVSETTSQIKSQDKIKAGTVQLSVLRPFPEKALEDLLSGKKGVAVLEGISGHDEAPLFREIQAAVSALGKRTPPLYSVRYAGTPSHEELRAVFNNMTRRGEQQRRLYLGIDFTRDRSASPQHEILLQRIRREYSDIDRETINMPENGQGKNTGGNALTGALPFAIRRYKDQGPPYTRLSRFYHDTAYFHQHRYTEELVADPFQSVPVLPAASANFTPVDADHPGFPVFHPQQCTACGDCFTYCPHSAMPSLAISMEAFIRGAMDIAMQQGATVSPLTPMVRHLAKAATQYIQTNTDAIEQAGDILPPAFEQLAGQVKMDDDKRTKLQSAVDALVAAAGSFPVAVTEPFFKEAGELFSIAIDPQACTGCGLCVETCEAGALQMGPPEAATVRRLKEQLRIWEQLPDTDTDTIRRLIHKEDYNAFAAPLLSRHFYLSMTGGASSEAGASNKTNLHLLTAVAESTLQPLVTEHIKKVQEFIDSLSENIHQNLSEALPDKDLHQLAQGMQEVQDDKLPLDAVIRHLNQKDRPALLDTDTLRRKSQLLDDLDNLRQLLAEGPTGNGRARLGMLLSGSSYLPWADDFPYNPFTVPVIRHWDGQAPRQLMGLMKGQQRHIVDQVRLLRRAGLEARDKYRPEVHDREIAALQWEDLDETEKRLLPPLFLVGDPDTLGAAGINGLNELLDSRLPLKVIILDDGSRLRSFSESVIMNNAATGDFTVIKGSLTGDTGHFHAIREAIHSRQPALLHLLIPDPEQHREGRQHWPGLVKLARRTRAFAAFHYDPEQAGDSLARAFALDSNPAKEDNWVKEAIAYEEGEAEVKKEYTYSYADWLFTLKDWQPQFRPVEADETTMPVADYLALDPEQQKGKTPVIRHIDGEGKRREYVASPQVIAATRQALRSWIHLRELAGAFTPFPEKIRKTVEQEVSEKYEQQIAALKAAHEAELQNHENDMMKRVRVQLREKLLALSRKSEIRNQKSEILPAPTKGGAEGNQK